MTNPLKWLRERKEKKRLAKQAREMTLATIENFDERDRVGILVPAQGTIMMHKYFYKVMRIREDYDTIVLKKMKEI